MLLSSPRAPTTSPPRSASLPRTALKVAAQGTGHGAAPLAPLEGTILLKTERMRGVEIDPDAGTARVEAGVLGAGPGSGSPLLLSELRHLGGALGRPDESGGALSHLDAGFALYSVGMPMTPELGEAIPAHLAKIEETMRPWRANGSYYNFVEGPCDVDAILPPDVCARLGEVKGKWDPDGRVVPNHAVSLGEV